MEQLSSLYLPLANKKSLPLLFTHDMPPILIADHARLSCILLEIMGNAIEFTEQGQVEIALSYAQDTKRLIFSVKDTGKGMPQAETEQILEPFHRLTPAYQHNTPGMGLGLSLVKSHLDAMGGQLEVNSVLGQGSCFTCSIPIDQPQHKLLIIEDNPIAQLALKMLLKNADCAYDMAACGQDALTLLEGNSYQLVISDLGLPDMEGISLAKQIKQQCPTLPIVALSAHINDKISQQCLAAGMQACYQKPLRMAQLDSILATYLVGGVV
jgi:CheY-like chemotaxis protein/anti-sigma regulatory factor (Ser/Thr protein kinase)